MTAPDQQVVQQSGCITAPGMGLGSNSPNFSSFGSNTVGIEISDVNTNVTISAIWFNEFSLLIVQQLIIFGVLMRQSDNRYK